jgi:hypothetical protein
VHRPLPRYKFVCYEVSEQQYAGGDEDRLVLRTMCEEGWDNVRGGSWSEPKFSPTRKAALFHVLRHFVGRCLTCGELDHYAKACPKQKVQNLALPWKDHPPKRTAGEEWEPPTEARGDSQ